MTEERRHPSFRSPLAKLWTPGETTSSDPPLLSWQGAVDAVFKLPGMPC
jgi:hypothetical protein